VTEVERLGRNEINTEENLIVDWEFFDD